MNLSCWKRTLGAAMVAPVLVCAPALAGPITPPPGPVASTHKTLTEVEPRVAINATNTPGDADASPSVYKITQPGSYYLTGNITGVSGRHGIEIVVSGVTIDLNGFDVSGVIGTGAFDGVSVTVSNLASITVRNGSVRNWGDDGVDLGTLSSTNGLIMDVRATNNGGDGIVVGATSSVSNCTASFNLSDGIQMSFNCAASGCVTSNNGLDGINGNVTNIISDCTAYLNGADGIGAGIASRITDCVSYDNVDEGLVIGSTGSIAGCAAYGNGGNGIELFFASSAMNCSSQNNVLHGIAALDRCTIIGNTCVRNGLSGGPASGIYVDGDTGRIEGNTCVENDRGIEIAGVRNLVIRNNCGGNSIANWDIDANNVCGPILNRTAPGSAAILGNSAPSSLGSTDANANYTH